MTPERLRKLQWDLADLDGPAAPIVPRTWVERASEDDERELDWREWMCLVEKWEAAR